MKVLKRHLEKDGHGSIQMRAEESEDMWHAYNLIAAGDRVRTSTVRKVKAHPISSDHIRALNSLRDLQQHA
jgi:protein pelota